jgi:glutathione S-transferase
VRIDGLARWRATSDVARKFQQGRVFLAGDAAHLMPPNGGFGGNTGIHDAHNLAWKLALVLKGTADPKLLATYEVERKPVGKFTVEQAYTRYVTRTAPYLGAKDFQPPANDFNIELGYLYRSPAIVPDGSEEKEHDDPRHTFGRPGSRAPHLWLERGGAGWTAQSAGRVSTLDLFGRAFVLLAGPDGAAWCSAAPQAAKAFPGLELQAHHIGGPALRDPDGRFAAAYGITPAGAVLVRPDGFVVWRAKQKESGAADAIARALRTALAKELSTTPILQTHFAAATHHAPTGCQAAGDCSITAPQDAAGSAHRREDVMKLYMHPVSMTRRPVRLFMAEKGLTADEEVIDLMTGAHYQEPYASLNPNKLVPMLDDDGFKLTESSAILKYLAEKFDLPEYPKDLKQRAKVNEMMDWLNTNFYREWGYGLCYPQLFPHLKRPDDNVQKATVEWGKEQSKKWLQILNDHWIGPNNQYLTGNTITIADYFGAGLVTLGELIRCDMAPYPNVTRWLDNMKKLKSWPQVNEVFNGLKDQLKGQPFVAV